VARKPHLQRARRVARALQPQTSEDIYDLAEAMGVDAEDIADAIGVRLEDVEDAEFWKSLDDDELNEVADIIDIDVSWLYDMKFGYEPGSHGK
jgi:hypothetical protein